MSNYPPDEPVYPATPIYDEAVAVTPVPPLEQGGSDSKASQAADQAKQTAGQAKDTVKQTAGDVKDQAAGVASTAKDAGAQVASTTKDEAQRVVADTVTQAKQLYGQATTELSSQAGKQQDRLTQTIRTFGEDLTRLGNGERVDSGPAAELIQNLAGRAHTAAQWLESRSPEDVLYEVRQLAARRPGLFIGLAAVTGVVAARLTKALTANAASGGSGLRLHRQLLHRLRDRLHLRHRRHHPVRRPRARRGRVHDRGPVRRHRLHRRDGLRPGQRVRHRRRS